MRSRRLTSNGTVFNTDSSVASRPADKRHAGEHGANVKSDEVFGSALPYAVRAGGLSIDISAKVSHRRPADGLRGLIAAEVHWPAEYLVTP